VFFFSCCLFSLSPPPPPPPPPPHPPPTLWIFSAYDCRAWLTNQSINASSPADGTVPGGYTR
jgi:hypothetical protein